MTPTTGTGHCGELRVRVEPAQVAVEPGGAVRAAVTVSSDSATALDVAIDALGPHAHWCRASPSTVRVEPGGETAVELTVSMPSVPEELAADGVIGVRARAVGTDVLPYVAELRVTPALAGMLRVELVPSVRRVTGRARFHAVVRNDAPLPVRVQLDGDPADAATAIRIRPTTLTVPARDRARARVVGRAPVPWSGPEPDRRFTLRARAGQAEADCVGTFVQRTRAGSASLLLAAVLALSGLAMIAALVTGV